MLKKCQWDTYYLLFIFYQSWAPSQTMGPALAPRSKSENFFLSARKLGFKGAVWGLMLRKELPGGGNQIPSP